MWFIPELEQALELGQIKILRVFEIWHWPKTSNIIFSEFVDFCVGQKVNYTGFPKDVVSEIQKLTYIENIVKHSNSTNKKSDY